MGKHSLSTNGCIILEIGGTTFSCKESTAKRIPGSRLSILNQKCPEYDHGKRTYCYDRDPCIFKHILNAHRDGELHVPKDVCSVQFRKEMEFWGIPPRLIAPCCWKQFYETADEMAVLGTLLETCDINTDMSSHINVESLGIHKSTTHSANVQNGNGNMLRKLWLFLEEPTSSTAAKIWCFLYIFIVIVSVITFLIWLEPGVRVPKYLPPIGIKPPKPPPPPHNTMNIVDDKQGRSSDRNQPKSLVDGHPQSHTDMNQPENTSKLTNNTHSGNSTDMNGDVARDQSNNGNKSGPKKSGQKKAPPKPPSPPHNTMDTVDEMQGKSSDQNISKLTNNTHSGNRTDRNVKIARDQSNIGNQSSPEKSGQKKTHPLKKPLGMTEVQFIMGTSDPHIVLLSSDAFCVFFFITETIFHFGACPHKCQYPRNPYNVLRIVLTISNIVTFVTELRKDWITSETIAQVLMAFRALSILRLLLIFRLRKFYSGLQIMLLSVERSASEFVLLFFMLIVATVIYGGFMFCIEMDTGTFPDTFRSMWWAVITMTTVGYGDYYPSKSFGYLIGVVCALNGLIVLAMPIAAIASNFAMFYSRSSDIQNHMKAIAQQQGTKGKDEETIDEDQKEMKGNNELELTECIEPKFQNYVYVA